MIRFLSGDDLGVPKIPECMVVEWTEFDSRVVFSFAQLGQGITAHFASGRESLREVKTAINDFCEWIFWAFPWCEMVFAVIGIESVERLAKKCGFRWIATKGPYQVYARYRQ